MNTHEVTFPGSKLRLRCVLTIRNKMGHSGLDCVNMGGTSQAMARFQDFRYLSESNEDGFETHFECQFSSFRI